MTPYTLYSCTDCISFTQETVTSRKPHPPPQPHRSPVHSIGGEVDPVRRQVMPWFLSTPRLSTSPLFAFLGVIVIAGG